MVRKSLFAVAVVLLAASNAQSAGLTGSTVSGALYCCTAPTEPYRISTVVSTTVGAAIEFPVNAFSFLSGGTWDEGALDVGEATIRLDLFAGGVTNPGTFNGFVFSFVGAPAIVGATVRAGSTVTPTGVSYTTDSIFINVASTPYANGNFFVVDVVTTPVPEPSVSSMLLFGLCTGAAALVRRRSRVDA